MLRCPLGGGDAVCVCVAPSQLGVGGAREEERRKEKLEAEDPVCSLRALSLFSLRGAALGRQLGGAEGVQLAVQGLPALQFTFQLGWCTMHR